MLSHERAFLLYSGGPAEGHVVDHPRRLEVKDRGDSSFMTIDVINIDGKNWARKRPNYPITPEARVGFDYVTRHLPEYPFLRQRFPETIIIDDPMGAYYLQELVQTKPGYGNMAKLSQRRDDLSQQGHFDLEQINSTEDLADILKLSTDGMTLFNKSLNDPESGLDPDVGWFLETNHPDSYVRGKLWDDEPDKIRFTDCHPIIAATLRGASAAMFNFCAAIDEVARTKFSTRLVDLSRTNGNDTPLPISLRQLSSLCLRES